MGRDAGIAVTFGLVVVGLAVIYYFMTNKQDPALVALEMGAPQKAVGASPSPLGGKSAGADLRSPAVTPSIPRATTTPPQNPQPTRIAVPPAGDGSSGSRTPTTPAAGADPRSGAGSPPVTPPSAQPNSGAAAGRGDPATPAPGGGVAPTGPAATGDRAAPPSGGGVNPPPAIIQPTGIPMPSQPRLPQLHVVEEGESLSLIAQRYYNNAARIAPILKANPAIKGANDIRIGMKLVIPEPGASAGGSGAAAGSQPTGVADAGSAGKSGSGLRGGRGTPPVSGAANPADGPATSAKSQRGGSSAQPTNVVAASRYTVREGDSLYSIARKQLGDQNRWSELHKLNRGVIGANADNLREGMVLRLPGEKAQTAAASQPAR